MRVSFCQALAAACVGLAGFGISRSFRTTGVDPNVPPVATVAESVTENPVGRGLDAALYMSSSAEYRAACYQAYNLAELRLKEAMAAPTDDRRKPAVVMDLDETVFDNGAFQAAMLRERSAYDQRVWDLWEETRGDTVNSIPGAVEFVRIAEAAGVKICYISNRKELYRAQTKRILERLGIPIRDESELLLTTEKNGTNKTSRRAIVEGECRVLLLVGDNLRDFEEKYRFDKLDPANPEVTALAIAARKAAVDRDRGTFGKRWVVIPNPSYGEWNKTMGRGRDDYRWLTAEK